MCNFGMHPGILAIFNFIEKPLNHPIEYDLFKNFTLEHRHSLLWWWWSSWRLLPAFSSHSAATWWDFPPFRWTCRQSARNHSASTVPWFESCDLPPSRWLTSSQGPKRGHKHSINREGASDACTLWLLTWIWTYLRCQWGVEAAHLLEEILTVDVQLAFHDVVEEDWDLLHSLKTLGPLLPVITR